MRNREQFTGIYREYHSLVRTVIYQIAGASALHDLTQEAFLRIWQGLERFREESSLKSWIYRISVNVALDALRLRKSRAEEFEYELAELPDPGQDLERTLSDRELVAEGLKALSPEHRAVVVLALIHERPLAEVAHVLGISEGTVKSRLHHAKEYFRRRIEKGAKAWTPIATKTT